MQCESTRNNLALLASMSDLIELSFSQDLVLSQCIAQCGVGMSPHAVAMAWRHFSYGCRNLVLYTQCVITRHNKSYKITNILPIWAMRSSTLRTALHMHVVRTQKLLISSCPRFNKTVYAWTSHDRGAGLLIIIYSGGTFRSSVQNPLSGCCRDQVSI